MFVYVKKQRLLDYMLRSSGQTRAQLVTKLRDEFDGDYDEFAKTISDNQT